MNEAMFVGEAVPLIINAFTSSQDSDLSERLAIKSKRKSPIHLRGTRRLTHGPGPISNATPPVKPPDNGCVCSVLRTVFGPSQE